MYIILFENSYIDHEVENLTSHLNKTSLYVRL